MNKYKVSYYYLATGMENGPDTKPEDIIEAESRDEALYKYNCKYWDFFNDISFEKFCSFTETEKLWGITITIIKNEEIKLIGTIDFKDIKVNVYNDPYTIDKNNITCGWQMRNLDSCYQGVMYMNNKTGKMSYPDDAIIPEQTDKDREMLPKFIVTGYETIDDTFISNILVKLQEGYKLRNNIK